MKFLFFYFLLIQNSFSITNSTYDVFNMSMIDKSKVLLNIQKNSLNISANSTSNIDFTIVDDVFFTGAKLINLQACKDDEVKIQVLAGASILATPIDAWAVGGIDKEVLYPSKLQAGLTLRVAYKNTCIISQEIKINYYFHKILL